jgi:hypothetical protein
MGRAACDALRLRKKHQAKQIICRFIRCRGSTVKRIAPAFNAGNRRALGVPTKGPYKPELYRY